MTCISHSVLVVGIVGEGDETNGCDQKGKKKDVKRKEIPWCSFHKEIPLRVRAMKKR
jgi:hypothetical protein